VATCSVGPTEVGEFASFYHMLNTTMSRGIPYRDLHQRAMHAAGLRMLAETLKQKLDISFGQTTPDGLFTLGGVECLGSCATAPMFSCTEKYTGKIRFFEKLDTPEKVDEALTVISPVTGSRLASAGRLAGYALRIRGSPPEDPASSVQLRASGAAPSITAATRHQPLAGSRRQADSHKIETYLADGGYETARAVLRARRHPTGDRRDQGRQRAGRGGAASRQTKVELLALANTRATWWSMPMSRSLALQGSDDHGI